MGVVIFWVRFFFWTECLSWGTDDEDDDAEIWTRPTRDDLRLRNQRGYEYQASKNRVRFMRSIIITTTTVNNTTIKS